MIKFIHIIIFFIILFIQPNYADNWWHFKFNTKSNTDYNIKKLHSNCNCTGEYFNKSLIEIKFLSSAENQTPGSRYQIQKSKLNTKFVKLFNKFLK
jgi:hypothetical protein